jgi:glycosyltransferase involved in cell wall biosynthesis
MALNVLGDASAKFASVGADGALPVAPELDASLEPELKRYTGRPIRVLIVAPNASARFGGEAFLPLHYFRLMRRRGIEAWLVSHARVREELHELLPREIGRMHFVEDNALDINLWKIGRRLPAQVATVSTGVLLHLETTFRQRAMVRELVQRYAIDLVHMPIPVSPKFPAGLWDVGAPVVIGPMNGGMTFPPGFRKRQGRVDRIALALARAASEAANLAIPGKRRASLLLVANQRTREALPRLIGDVPVEELVENGVDLARFRPRKRTRAALGAGAPFVAAFVGRLVGWKAIDLLVNAMARLGRSGAIQLEIFGDGPMRATLEQQVAAQDLGAVVRFHGFVAQETLADRLAEVDALVLPSLSECGGAVVLEAMAVGLPVIATRWGGPADYLDDSCGVLLEPLSAAQLTEDLAGALRRLANEPELADRLAYAARQKAAVYDWERKIDRMLALYQQALERAEQVAL